MIQIDHVQTCGWEAAVRGMRNPMNSWEKSDSGPCKDKGLYIIGPNDLALMQKLVQAGTDHSKFMRMISISMDITAPLYWWKEFDTYKIGTVSDSCSTMHKIHARSFTLDDFSHEHMLMDVDEAGSEIIDQRGNDTEIYVTPLSLLKLTVDCLNNYRLRFLQTQDKKWWWQMIQLLPSSYNQLRTVTLNYQVARNIYHARRNHKLNEWHGLCDALEGLPCAKELIVA